MSDSDGKESLNYPLLLATIVIIAIMVGAATMKLLGGDPETKVAKVKITKEQLADFTAHIDEMVAGYTVRVDEKGWPVVHPPAGSDVYILARAYNFGRFTLELEKGKSYQLKLTSNEIRHGIAVRELKLKETINLGEIRSVAFRPEKAGTFDMVCSEFCGYGHESMVGRLIVTE
ncbi:MAG: hypothetical protein K9M17_02145 [Mariprofundaceae bacterium]|nr:hypothetical protein [Mariprofundaceae bacterium]